MRALVVVTLAALFVATFGCGPDYKPGPLDPSSAEAGKKPCSANEDCASHVCGPDHRCA
jgi:hypothetical protein